MNKKNPKASADEVEGGLVIKGEGWGRVQGQRGPQGARSCLQAGGRRWGSQGPPGRQLARGEAVIPAVSAPVPAPPGLPVRS